MPSAEKLDTTETHDLKSLKGGTVTLQRMSYGESVARRAMMKMSFATGGNSKDNSFQGEMAMASVDIQQFEFSKCIVDHNLEYNNGTKMDFRSKATLDKLDPKIGGEIEELISKMNDFDADEDASEANLETDALPL